MNRKVIAIVALWALATPQANSANAAEDTPVATDIERLSRSPNTYNGKRISLAVCLHNEFHGVFVYKCGTTYGEKNPHLRIILISRPNSNAAAYARFKSLFPSVVPIKDPRYPLGYETRLTGTFWIADPPPTLPGGSGYLIFFESDTDTLPLWD